MNPSMMLAVVCGLTLGLGFWLVLVRLPFMRMPSFAERIEPRLRAVSAQSKLLAVPPSAGTTFGPLERILRPLLKEGIAWLSRFDPGNAALSRKLAQAGRRQSPADFRAGQLLWAAGGFVLAAATVGLTAVAGRFSAPLAAVAVVGSALGFYLLRDYLLMAEIRRREKRMLAEFPGLADLMALAVGAGESATGALERVCRRSRGELSEEFARILAETRAGTPFVQALTDFSKTTRLAPLVRFIDGLIVAVQRGTPLADVLRAQAQDVRDVAKRELMESAGKKEIAMMVPVVFGVLPLTVLFAVYPGIALLRLGF